jgi:hypothetical protein
MAIDVNIPSQVKNYANLAAFPATGTLKTIFIAEDTNKTYRWTGSAYVEISAAGATGITIGTTAITSGTVGRVLFEGTGNVVQESANLFWDNTNGRLGVGTSSPTNAVDITQTGGGFLSFNRTAGASASISITNIRTGGGQGLVFDTASFSFRNGSSKNLILDGGRIGVNTNDDALTASFNVKGTGATSATKNILFKNSANTDLFTIWDDGAVGVKTSTNAGFAFDVNGTARVVTKVVTPILEGVSSGRVDLKYGFGTSTPSSNILSVGYAGEPAILIGSGTTQNSSMIQMNSTTQGFLPPRMTTTQKNAIATPATGLMVYDTTLNLISVYNGTTWITL